MIIHAHPIMSIVLKKLILIFTYKCDYSVYEYLFQPTILDYVGIMYVYKVIK